MPSTLLGKIALRHSFNLADQKESKFVICTDPMGETILMAERKDVED